MRKLIAALLLFTTTTTWAASRMPLEAKHAMVASKDRIASKVGVDIMKKGGNAVDAAVAVAFALAVTWPAAGNIGGGGFMLIRTADGKAEAIDYRERAPWAATRDMYLDANGTVIKGLSTDGWKAVGVPGTVAGLALAHKRHGKLPWKDLVEPARKLAAGGFTVDQFYAHVLRLDETGKKINPFAESRRIFLRDGRPFETGQTFVQPELARVLARIEKDPRDFYEGETAGRIVSAMKKNGGLVTAKDLKSYAPAVREPLRGGYRGHELIVMPPPSSGGIALIEMFHMLEHYELASMEFGSARYDHTMLEVMRRAFADRSKFLGDPDFVKLPVATLTSPEWADERMKSIDPDRATPSTEIGPGSVPGYESSDTTHFSIVDPDGNMVSNTYTLNDWFGAGVTVPGTGILLNNEMDDFTSHPGVPNEYGLIQGPANAIQPNKRPLSSMTPVIALDHGKPWLAVGAAGGPRIITTVLEIIVNLVDFKMDLQEALDASRIHHQWMPDEVYWENLGVNPDTRAALEKMGYAFRSKPLDYISDANAVMVDPATGVRIGAGDPRREGWPAGW
jgi:gamma-glutamyltranspeptidase/glutathione hydrolase